MAYFYWHILPYYDSVKNCSPVWGGGNIRVGVEMKVSMLSRAPRYPASLLTLSSVFLSFFHSHFWWEWEPSGILVLQCSFLAVRIKLCSPSPAITPRSLLCSYVNVVLPHSVSGMQDFAQQSGDTSAVTSSPTRAYEPVRGKHSSSISMLAG